MVESSGPIKSSSPRVNHAYVQVVTAMAKEAVREC